ncbi:endonuclease/exonuclease/phosphatase family protein [Pelistega sp. MC2]|uniref:endonuclease/exonuclease/phosphatase family protein n=1 Tax=Pelistega sp. MC2 TaxID=1720297 RepID=UPI000A8EC0E6|nr:endonuclease/exonuclease/phosphatase family protein [Pelistega sp. MC2]
MNDQIFTIRMSQYDVLLIVLMGIPILATILPFIRHDHWVFRVFDFPRLQIAILSLLCFILNLIFIQDDKTGVFLVVECINLVCFVYQLKEISAYTFMVKSEVLAYKDKPTNRTISLLISNVLTSNRRSDLLLAQINKWQPDIVLTLESDKWWEIALEPLEKVYPNSIKIPLDNLYGMHLYSRLPLRHTEVRHWVEEDIPSIVTQVQLRSGEWIDIYCLHPQPPSPTEADTSTARDAELLLVGREIAKKQRPSLVFGDLNDVAWSRTTRLFQRISGLLDPRIGRGLYSTFNANYRFLRWPLDHIFHSNDFMVIDIKVLPFVGSDHFPIYGRFQYAPSVGTIQELEEATPEDNKEASHKIAEAEPIKEVIDTDN